MASKIAANSECVHCNLCGGSDAPVRFHPRRSPGPIVQCRHCGLAYVNPRERRDHIVADAQPWLDLPAELRLSKDIADLEQCWEKSLIEDYLRERIQKTANAHRLLALIEQFVPKGRILDFGCGPGLFLSAAKDRGWQTHGLEPLVGFAIFCRGHLGLDVTQGVLQDDTFPKRYFDVVAATQVLEHLPDPLGTLRRLHNITRPGGLITVEVPNISNIWVTLLGSRHRHFVEDHLYFFSPSTLRRMLEKAGFKVVKQGHSTRLISGRALIRQTWRNIGIKQDRLTDLVSKLPLCGATISLNLGDIIYALAVRQDRNCEGG